MGFNHIFYRHGETVQWGDNWELPMGWEEFYRVGNACLHSCWYVALVVPVVLGGDIDIESWGSMIVPGISLHMPVVNNDFTSWGH